MRNPIDAAPTAETVADSESAETIVGPRDDESVALDSDVTYVTPTTDRDTAALVAHSVRNSENLGADDTTTERAGVVLPAQPLGQRIVARTTDIVPIAADTARAVAPSALKVERIGALDEDDEEVADDGNLEDTDHSTWGLRVTEDDEELTDEYTVKAPDDQAADNENSGEDADTVASERADSSVALEDPLDQYRRDISKYPMLARDVATRKLQEAELAKRIEAGRAAAAALEASGSLPDQQLRESIELTERNLTRVLGREPTTTELVDATQQSGTAKGLSEEVADKIRTMNDGVSAERRFIEANLRMVVSRAKAIRPTNMGVMDRVQAGNVGLVRAVRTFDATKGCTLATYARPVIDDAIRKASLKEGDRLTLTRVDQERIVTVRLEQRRLESLGNGATAADIATSLKERDLAFDFTEEAVADLLTAGSMAETSSLNKSETSKDGSEDTEFGDIYAVDTGPSPEEITETGDLANQLQGFLAKPPDGFSASQARALSLRFFGNPVKGELMDYADIAEEMQLSDTQGARNFVNRGLKNLGQFAGDPRLAGLKEYY